LTVPRRTQKPRGWHGQLTFRVATAETAGFMMVFLRRVFLSMVSTKFDGVVPVGPLPIETSWAIERATDQTFQTNRWMGV